VIFPSVSNVLAVRPEEVARMIAPDCVERFNCCVNLD
jgi:hypothetical protein